MLTLSFLLAIAVLGLSTQEPEIAVETLGPSQWRLTTEVTGSADIGVAQRRLLPRAVQLCQGAAPVLGHYRFEATSQIARPEGAAPAPDTVRLIQDLSCAPGRSTRPPPVTVSIDPVVPTVVDEALANRVQPDVATLSTRYFSALEEDRLAEAFALTTPEMRGGADLEAWSAARRAERAQHGPLQTRRLVRYTLYGDPPNAPAPGLYVAVDYVAERSAETECGYLIWHRRDETRPFLLIRQETTFIPDAIDPAVSAPLRAQHCRDASVEPSSPGA